MLNPNFIYCSVFLVVIALYQLGWSDLYPQLQSSLLLFLFMTICLNVFLGLIVKKLNFFDKNTRLIIDKSNNEKLITFALLVFWCIDKYFGDIPTIHIILITFTSFYSIYIFSRLLQEKKRSLLFVFITLFLIVSLLATYRILIFYNLITYMLTYIYVKKPFESLKGKLIISVSILAILFTFGYLGNNLKGSSYNSGELILTIGEASTAFRTSFIPNEFFWTYLYASSPLANLELNVEHNHTLERSGRGMFLWMTSEFVPDFISTKIFKIMNEEPVQGLQVNSALNVSTVYLKSFRYAGWPGITVMALFIAVFPIIYLFIIRNSKYFIPGLVSLITIYLFLVFDNLFVFSALSFQLIYPILGRINIFRKS